MKTKLLDSRSAYLVIFLFGIVSLMGDVVYESSKGITPDYLYILGASATIVGLVGGLGDAVGYILRLVSGYLADSTHAYWLFIFVGYGLIGAIPLLGFTTIWEIAIMLFLLERLGKALRTPSRDTILSVVSQDVGMGKAFGFHELMDQIGATGGPLMMATIMFITNNNYSITYIFLFLPFALLAASLAFAYKKVGARTISMMEKTVEAEKTSKLGKGFYIYTAAVSLNTIGLIHPSLIVVKSGKILNPLNMNWMVPLIYMLIQGVDAATAIISGLAYDKYGLKVLLIPFIISVFPSLLTPVASELVMLAVAATIFGVVLGMQESTYRAAVSKFAPATSRGKAYGIFNTAYGLTLLASGGIFGFFLDQDIPMLMIVPFVIVTQVIAIIALMRASLTSKPLGKVETTH